ncbi:hypothetical protein KSS87_020906, partial [Heliosperma pusillum]
FFISLSLSFTYFHLTPQSHRPLFFSFYSFPHSLPIPISSFSDLPISPTSSSSPFIFFLHKWRFISPSPSLNKSFNRFSRLN